ncbi:unnamed protein product [Aphanomyces euteiches]|uniref:Uncharacterized protein n=1 Tax=Aphanomyces euteiches TaxID=100861 RepID=A0A6G0WAI9_9STRA|nr:hypothetical protein Ae201684_017104 [Aphanomyces euteiches]KAH9094128.1 hypothetical protein Ae201684P_016743 [Aphanomyces euteiches]
MLTLDLRDGQVSGETLSNVLAPLNHLKTLKLVVKDDSLVGAVFAFAKSSVQLTHLDMDGCKYPLLTPSIGNNLIAWFDKQPVQVFKFPGWSVNVQHLDLLIAVENIVFNCATLEILECSTFLPWSDYSKLTFPMPTLTLRDLHSSQMYVASAFVKSLTWSAVRHLALTNTVDPSRLLLRGIDTLFQMLVQTQIVTLELAGCRLCEQEWIALAEHLPQYRRVGTLSLVNVGMTSQYAEEIASAMLTNNSIQALDVGGNDLDSECIATLIHACTHPDRPVQIRSIRFQGCGIELEDYNDQCIEKRSRIEN